MGHGLWIAAVALTLMATAQEPNEGEAPSVMPRRGGPGNTVVIREGDDPAARFAEMHLMRGMPLQAVTAARKCLEAKPNSLQCRDVLGRAAAQAGNCGPALDALAIVRGTAEWSARSAMAEGLCRVKSGELEYARAVFDEAWMLNPNLLDVWTQRGLINARLRDFEQLDDDIWRLVDEDPEPWQLDLLELWRDHAADDPGADAIIASYAYRGTTRSERGMQVHIALVACERWIAVSDPHMALAVSNLGAEMSRGHVRLSACRAEATRLDGDPVLASAIVERPWNVRNDTPLLDAVNVRAYVDMGRLEEAAAIQAELPDAYEPSAVLSAWYLARALGDANGMSHARSRLHGLVADVDRALASLIPAYQVP